MEYFFYILLVFANDIARGENCLHANYISCNSKDQNQCVPSEWWCDGHIDCNNGRDEANCTSTICHKTEISCKTGTQCIPKILHCDGMAQCLDQSDEDGCVSVHSKSCDFRTQFDCYNDGEHCISLEHVCDGKNDCGSNEDERPGGSNDNCQRNDCRLIENGGCSHFCTNLYTQIVCHCRDGHRLLDDKKTCVDIDECSLLPTKCSQICNNTVGGYQCLCHDGYILNPNVFGECIAKDGDRLLLFTLEYGDIISVDLAHNNSLHNMNKISSGWTNIDIFVNDLSLITVFWSKFKDKMVGKSVISRKPDNSYLFDVISEVEIFRLPNASFCSGLSYDWFRSLLFWTSPEEGRIYVTNTTSNISSILKTNLDNPRSIAVDPLETRIYWIDWGNKSSSARIETMLMNTEDQRILVKGGLRQPQSLTIDFLGRRLYWSDINPGSIIFIDLNQPILRKTVISNQLLHPFTLSIFEAKVFWTDWRHNQVISVGKTVGKDMKIVAKVSKPMSIGVMNKVVKPQISSDKYQIHTCINSQSHLCSDLCLPSPPTTNRLYASIKCLCAMDSFLSDDKTSCINDNSFILPNNIHRFKIIVTVMFSLMIIIILSISIILIYLCREKLYCRSYTNMSQQRMKHRIVNGDLMFIFKCQSHSSQLSELLNNDFSSTNIA